MTNTRPVIAIDGPAASGKGTIARKIAAALDFNYLDTGLLYRAIGYGVTSTGGNPSDLQTALTVARSLPDRVKTDPAFLQNPDLHTDATSESASLVASMQDVRDVILALQRDFAQNPGKSPNGNNYLGAVLDGRDIGTVICPAAPAKLFVSAAVETRAERRLKELQSRGIITTYEAVLRDMRERDARDAERKIAPMKPAGDALELDTTDLNPDQAFEKAMDYIRSRL
ncbi:MAG: (d)CMP kinase [Micavibrio sp.]|nr:(d)CMP kinase [Micavibrio sp.]